MGVFVILKKEFTFVRHGQTEHNRQKEKTDHGDIPLNKTGVEQAKRLAPLLGHFKSIYCSPLRRAKETKELIVPHTPHQEVADLGECTALIWEEMTSLGRDALSRGGEEVRCFLEQVKRGVNGVLEQESSALIVSHGGVHWAICYWMGIENHDWMIGNCEPVHFFIGEGGAWKARWLS